MKLLFVIYRRSDVTHEQALAEWGGPQHTAIVGRLQGLKKWVQNHAGDLPSEAAADGVGELWFESSEAMERAMNSPEMAAAVEDAKRFLDMHKTYALVVDEKSVM